jgi:hypothetical protein
MKVLGLAVILMILTISQSVAQCAMCRATLENNLSNGNPGIATGINVGIMYLFFAPYLAVGLIAYFWYRTSRANARKEFESRNMAR